MEISGDEVFSTTFFCADNLNRLGLGRRKNLHPHSNLQVKLSLLLETFLSAKRVLITFIACNETDLNFFSPGDFPRGF